MLAGPQLLLRALALVALMAAAISAQVQSRLTGTVTDNTGAVIVGASVVATNLDTQVTYPARSNESGTYIINFVPPGNYELKCELEGFKSFVRKGLVLETGFTRTVDIRLELGAMAEAVTVTAETPLLESESSTVGQLIERSNVIHMPVESRRSASLIRLMGMVVYREEANTEQIPRFSMAGGRSGNQMWTLDGGTVQNMTLGVPILGLNPPAESLQEFKAEATNYSAEFGRTSGGAIMMTTRSGTNSFHGAAYEFLRNDKLDTRTFFSPGKAPLRYNIFGGSVGGPVIRDRTFFFFNYEGARRRDGRTFADSDVPHPAEIEGDFSARTDVRVLDPLTRQPFPNNIIPASRIDPIAQAFARYYPAPNITNNDVRRAPVDNFVVNVSDAVVQDFYTARVDHTFSTNDRIYGRYSLVKAYSLNAPLYPEAAADSRAQRQDNDNTSLLVSWIRNIRPTLLNELRYNYGNRLNIVRAAGTGSGLNGKIGLKGVEAQNFARINVTGLTPLGAGSHERIQTPIYTQQFVDNLTWIRGKHQIKTGFEFRYSLNKDDNNNTAGGSFTFNDRATGSGLATMLLGYTSSASIQDTDIIASRSDTYGLYVQDDWKVTPNLTLNLGLRWELDTPRWEKEDNRQSGFAFSTMNPVAGVPGVVTFSGRDGRSRYANDFDPNNFSPRFGFAWRVRPTLVIRGGYGLAYAGMYERATAAVMILGFSRNGDFTSPDGGLTPAFLFRNGMPSTEREPLGPGFGTPPPGGSPRVTADFILQDQVNSYAHQYNYTIQKELRGGMLFEAAYLGNLGHKLGGPNLSQNMIPLVDGRGPAAQNQRLRPFPQFTDVVMLNAPVGNSSYHAMNLKLEKRYSNGLNFLMNYTWSKFLDDVQANNELGGVTNNGYTHIERRKLDKSYSGNDIRRRYVASAVYDLPWGVRRGRPLGNAFLNAVAGDWGLGTVAEFRTGTPYGAIEQTNLSNTFSAGVRPNLLRDPAINTSRGRGEMIAGYFDVTAFQAPGAGNFGNAAREVGFGPGFVGLDGSIHKRWPIKERFNLQFRADFFNALNRPNFANPNTSRGRADFGRISSILVGSTGRRIQLGLRLEF
jgi:hypothetical protein